MKPMLIHELKINRKYLIYWVSAIWALNVVCAVEFKTLYASLDQLYPVLSTIPQVVKSLFGMGMVSMEDPDGWYVCMHMWCCLITFSHASFIGAIIISKEECGGTSEYIYTKPYSRNQIITVKITAAAVQVAVVTFSAWLSSAFLIVPLLGGTRMQKTALMTMAGMFLMQLIYLAFGLLCSALFGSMDRAVKYSMLFYALSYVISVAIETYNAEFLGFLTPFRYFYAPIVIASGFRPLYLLLTLLILSASSTAVFRCYRKKDMK